MPKFPRCARLVLSGLIPLTTLLACAPAVEGGGAVPPGVSLNPAGADAAAAAGSRYSRADVDFMQAMLHHHAQAVVMTEMVEQRTRDERIRLLGRRIALSQEGEMEMMIRWLERRGEEVPDLEHGHHGMHADMPGMLNAEQLDRLERATGPAFDRLFLEYMIQHHEGALIMVQQLLRTEGAAQETEIFQFAIHVDSDQQVEIDRMREMLERLP